MKSTSVLAAAALLALAAACSKKEEPKPSETNITSAPVERDDSLDRPSEMSGGTTITGGSTDPGYVPGSGATMGTTEGASGAGAGGTTGSLNNGSTTGSLNNGSTTGSLNNGSTTGSGTGAGGGTDLSGGLGSGRDAGIVGSVPLDRQGSSLNTGSGSKGVGTSEEHVGERNNKSTPLGDGTSGQYTGGKGTYGGKATHGTSGTGGDSNAKSNSNTKPNSDSNQ